MIPRFPFQGDIFVANGYLLFFFTFAFNFDLIHFSLNFLQWDCHLDPQFDSDLTIKKARKEVV